MLGFPPAYRVKLGGLHSLLAGIISAAWGESQGTVFRSPPTRSPHELPTLWGGLIAAVVELVGDGVSSWPSSPAEFSEGSVTGPPSPPWVPIPCQARTPTTTARIATTRARICQSSILESRWRNLVTHAVAPLELRGDGSSSRATSDSSILTEAQRHRRQLGRFRNRILPSHHPSRTARWRR